MQETNEEVLNLVLYKCDPQLNTECPKTSCQRECFHTSRKEYSADGVPHTVRELLRREGEN